MKPMTLLLGGALTAAVMALTPVALADAPTPDTPDTPDPNAVAGPPVAPPPAPAAPPGGTPLNLRPAPAPFGTGGGAGSLAPQLALVALAAAGGLWLYKRRARASADEYKPPKILSRTAVGVRSELLVVEVEGQVMLIGVTPQSIQRIAVLSVLPSAQQAVTLQLAEPTEEPGFRSLWNDDTLQDVEAPRHSPAQAQSLAEAAARINAIARSTKGAAVLSAMNPRRPVPIRPTPVPPESGTKRVGGEIEEQARGLLERRGRP